jgi:hypothetical protein
VFLIRLALDNRFLDTRALCWRIATLSAFRCEAVHLHELGIINVSAESAFNRFQIGAVSIG